MNNYPPGLDSMDPHFNPDVCPECGREIDEDVECVECGYEFPEPDEDAAYDDAKQEGRL